MYRVVSVSPAGHPDAEDLESANAALELGRKLIAAGHTELMVTTPDERAFLFREFSALMGAAEEKLG
jgi:hypothetical protein